MSIRARLAQLEARFDTSEEGPRFYMIYIGAEEPADLRDEYVVTYLPRKYASAEAWDAAMRKEFGYFLDGKPDSNVD